MSGSGISWAICKSAPRSRQITMPASHCSFLQARCPSCRPINNVKALKANREIVNYAQNEKLTADSSTHLTFCKTKSQLTNTVLHSDLLLKEKFFKTRTSTKKFMSNHKLQIPATCPMGNNITVQSALHVNKWWTKTSCLR